MKAIALLMSLVLSLLVAPLGDENEKRTGIVNPLNSASTHTMTSFSRFDFCSSFCTNFQDIYRLLPPPKGRGEAVHQVHIMHSYLKGRSTNVLKSSISIMVNTSSS
jgi:hypothetical protein